MHRRTINRQARQHIMTVLEKLAQEQAWLRLNRPRHVYTGIDFGQYKSRSVKTLITIDDKATPKIKIAAKSFEAMKAHMRGLEKPVPNPSKAPKSRPSRKGK